MALSSEPGGPIPRQDGRRVGDVQQLQGMNVLVYLHSKNHLLEVLLGQSPTPLSLHMINTQQVHNRSIEILCPLQQRDIHFMNACKIKEGVMQIIPMPPVQFSGSC